MTERCACTHDLRRRRIVLTGGPGAGKTAVLALLKLELCEHVAVLPEAAGIVFGGGFPRTANSGVRAAAQRAIYHVQRELEAAADAQHQGIVLCDRGVVDGAAYWPKNHGDYWQAVGIARADALRRYDAVIHLRVPDAQSGYGHSNPLRLESAAEAAAIDQSILDAWDGHPRQYVIGATPDFLEKATRALDAIRVELPECCRSHTERALATINGAAHALAP